MRAAQRLQHAGLAILTFLSMAAAAHAIAADWVPVGPSGGDVRVLIADPDDPMRAWAATASGGIFRTDDGGDRWTRASVGLPSREVLGLALGGVAPSRLYAVTAAGVALSTDGAETWTPIPLVPAYTTIVAATPLDAGIAMIVSASQALRTQDGGVTWSSLPFEAVTPFAGVFRDVVFDAYAASTVYAAVPGRFNHAPAGCSTSLPDTLLRSRDGGDTWEEAVSGIPTTSHTFQCAGGLLTRSVTTRVIWQIASDPHHQNRLLALADSEPGADNRYAGPRVLYRSLDGGDSWAPVDLGPGEQTFQSVHFDPSTPGVLYALWTRAIDVGVGTIDMLRSDDDGASWTLLDPPFPGTAVGDIALSRRAAGTILATVSGGVNGSGIARSTDHGTTWTAAQRGLDVRDITAVIADPDGGGAFLADTFRTADAGASWERLALPDTVTKMTALASDVNAPGNVFLSAGDGLFGEGVFVGRAFEAGPFEQLELPFGARSIATEHGVPGRIYAVLAPYALCNVAVSDDGGASWEYDLLTFPSEALCIAEKNVIVAPGGSAGVFIGFETLGGVHHSIDGGRTWLPARAGLPDTVRALATDPNEPATLWAGTPEGVFRTADAGTTWEPLDDGLTTTDVRALAVDPQRPDVAYAGTSDGVFKRIGHRAWTRLGGAIDGFDVRGLAVDPTVPTRLLAGTVGGSAFRLEQDTCGDGVVHPGEHAPDEVRCDLRGFAADLTCSNDRFRSSTQRRLERGITILERSTGTRALRRIDRLLRRVRARARRFAVHARITEECLAGVDAGVALSRGAIGDALLRR